MRFFTHDPINLDGPGFRLLRLRRGEGADSIRCEVFQASLHHREQAISYEAISYTWGSKSMTDDIEVNGRRFRVGLNLYQLFHYLRLRDQDRILWVDAVCIDQNNNRERGHQVQQMRHIYKQADRVLFWLGQSTYETNVFMDSILWLQKESNKHAWKGWKRTDPNWLNLWTTVESNLKSQYPSLHTLQTQGLQNLLRRPWFTRVWILQEVANAQSALLCCGTKFVRASFFALTPTLLGITPDDHCQAVLDIMPGPLRHDSWWNTSRELFWLLKKFGQSKAHDPRDMIYALLGMSSDAKDVLIPDYEKSEKQLVHDAISFLFFRSIGPARVAEFTKISQLLASLTSLQDDALRKLPGSDWAMYEFLLKPILSKKEELIRILWNAARDGHETIIQWLLSNGAKADLRDSNGWTLLSWTAAFGWEAIVKMLLENGAPIDSRDPDGRTAVSRAARRHSIEVLKLLLDRGAQVNLKDNDGRTPLFHAITSLEIDHVLMLLEKQAQVEATDIQGWTPLSLAAELGWDRVINLLRERGARTDVRDAEGQTPLSRAAEKGYAGTVKLLLESGAPVDLESLSRAVLSGREEVVKLLLEGGGKALLVNPESRKLLSQAVEIGHFEIIKLLLDNGAQADMDDISRSTSPWRLSRMGGGSW